METDRKSANLPSQTKYLQIFDTLRKNLLTGTYEHGARLPSEAELTRKFKVSRMTVARAMQQLQREGLVSRRAGSGTFAVTKGARDSLVFGLLIPDLGQTEIFEPICRGMARSPQASGHSLLWGHSLEGTESQEQQALDLCDHYLQQSVNGVFFAPIEFTPRRDEVNHRILIAFDRARIPVILLDRCAVRFPGRSPHDLVGLDNRRAAYVLTEHLIAVGAKRIAFVAREGSAETVDTRILGCREALFARDRQLVITLSAKADDFDLPKLRRLVTKSGVDAFICANDHTAANLMKALLSLGIKVPEEARVVGFDDVRYAGVLPVPLTTMHQPCADIGAAAMSAMMERIQHPNLKARSIMLDAHLIVRQSCGGASRAAASGEAGAGT